MHVLLEALTEPKALSIFSIAGWIVLFKQIGFFAQARGLVIVAMDAEAVPEFPNETFRPRVVEEPIGSIARLADVDDEVSGVAIGLPCAGSGNFGRKNSGNSGRSSKGDRK